MKLRCPHAFFPLVMWPVNEGRRFRVESARFWAVDWSLGRKSFPFFTCSPSPLSIPLWFSWSTYTLSHLCYQSPAECPSGWGGAYKMGTQMGEGLLVHLCRVGCVWWLTYSSSTHQCVDHQWADCRLKIWKSCRVTSSSSLGCGLAVPSFYRASSGFPLYLNFSYFPLLLISLTPSIFIRSRLSTTPFSLYDLE